MSTQFVPPPGANGQFESCVTVPRPGVVQTIGGALNQAFGTSEAVPDNLAELLRTLDQINPKAGDPD